MTYQGGKYQMIVTATELEMAGINAGEIKSLWLNVSNLTMVENLCIQEYQSNLPRILN